MYQVTANCKDSTISNSQRMNSKYSRILQVTLQSTSVKDKLVSADFPETVAFFKIVGRTVAMRKWKRLQPMLCLSAFEAANNSSSYQTANKLQQAGLYGRL